MSDPDRLIALLTEGIAMIHELRLLAVEAKRRGDARADAMPLDYWYGVQFGYEDAAQRLESFLGS